MWVDVPLKDPRNELPTVGREHLWTGLAEVQRTALGRANDGSGVVSQ